MVCAISEEAKAETATNKSNNMKAIEFSAIDLEFVLNRLSILKLSCEEALDETWDKSDDGFEAMIDIIDQIAEKFQK